MHEHYRKLERMYLSAPLHNFYDTLTIKINKGEAELTLQCDAKYFHAAGAMHGSVYFKLLDDAAYFASSSLVDDLFLLTTSFNIHFVRPVTKGKLIAKGKVKFSSPNLIVAETHLYNEQGKEVAFGTGDFMKSKILLDEKIQYK